MTRRNVQQPHHRHPTRPGEVMNATSVIRILWGFYLAPLLVAAACFVGLVVTGSPPYQACGLMACLASWFVTDHLDDARFEARVRARSAP
jgi:hypothetical protein